MAILFTTSWSKDTDFWLPALQECLPEFPLLSYTGDGDPIDFEAVEYAIVWQPPPGVLKKPGCSSS